MHSSPKIFSSCLVDVPIPIDVVAATFRGVAKHCLAADIHTPSTGRDNRCDASVEAVSGMRDGHKYANVRIESVDQCNSYVMNSTVLKIPTPQRAIGMRLE